MTPATVSSVTVSWSADYIGWGGYYGGYNGGYYGGWYGGYYGDWYGGWCGGYYGSMQEGVIGASNGEGYSTGMLNEPFSYGSVPTDSLAQTSTTGLLTQLYGLSSHHNNLDTFQSVSASVSPGISNAASASNPAAATVISVSSITSASDQLDSQNQSASTAASSNASSATTTTTTDPVTGDTQTSSNTPNAAGLGASAADTTQAAAADQGAGTGADAGADAGAQAAAQDDAQRTYLSSVSVEATAVKQLADAQVRAVLTSWGTTMMQSIPPKQWNEKVEDLIKQEATNGTPLDSKVASDLRKWIGTLAGRATLAAQLEDNLHQIANAEPATPTSRAVAAKPPRQATGYWDEVFLTAKGYFWDAPIGLVSGTASMIAHPIDTAIGLGNAIAHPILTATAIKNKIVEDAQTPEGRGQIAFNIVTIVLPASKAAWASRVNKAAKASQEATEAVNLVKQAAEAAEVATKTELAAEAAKTAETA